VPKLPVVACVIVERLPVVVPLPSPAEEAHEAVVEAHASETRKHLEPGWERMGAPDTLDAVGRQRREEEGLSLKAAFEAGMAARVPPTQGDRTSAERHLPKRVYLVHEGAGQALAMDGTWAFPSARRERGESMLEAAMRAARGCMGNDAVLHAVSALPVAHHVHRGEDGHGARVFFYRVQYVAGETESGADKEWLSLWELGDRLDGDFLASVRPALRK
jgi:ADP-ribose pyrophosphatase YjhB (NUDIX family)